MRTDVYRRHFILCIIDVHFVVNCVVFKMFDEQEGYTQACSQNFPYMNDLNMFLRYDLGEKL